MSDVENIRAARKLFQVNVNLDNLKDVLEGMASQIEINTAALSDVNDEVKLRATELTMGKYLERISQAVHKDVGERPHVFKLDEPSFLQNEFQTPHGVNLKNGVEKVIEKMEIISKASLFQKRFKKNAEVRIKTLEEQQKLNV